MVCYLDDCLFIASSVEVLRAQMGYALHFFHSLGLTINVRKSVLEPTQRVTFLDVVLDSVSLTLPSCRRECIREKRFAPPQKRYHLTRLVLFYWFSGGFWPSCRVSFSMTGTWRLFVTGISLGPMAIIIPVLFEMLLPGN